MLALLLITSILNIRFGNLLPYVCQRKQSNYKRKLSNYKMQAKNLIEDLLVQLPMNTVDAKKNLAAHLKCSHDKVDRWIRDPYTTISTADLGRALLFFQKHLPETELKDLVTFVPETA
jgi:hypothetical protein